jgi:hypothetical protein
MSPSRDQAFIDALAERLRAQQRGASEAREPNPKTNGHRTLHRPLSLVRELEPKPTSR